MAEKNLSHSLLGAGNEEPVAFNGGLNPGLDSSAEFRETSGRFNFEVLSMGATVYSYTSVSVLANTSTVQHVAHVLAKLIQELQRERVIRGTRSI